VVHDRRILLGHCTGTQGININKIVRVLVEKKNRFSSTSRVVQKVRWAFLFCFFVLFGTVASAGV